MALTSERKVMISKTCTVIGWCGCCVLHVHAYKSIYKPLYARAYYLVFSRQGLSLRMRFPISPLGLYSCIPLTLGLYMLVAMPGFHVGAEDQNSGHHAYTASVLSSQPLL